MRILLTGLTGQVGGALRAPLGELGTVVAADRNELDLSRPERIADVLNRLKPELIVNPAAYTAVDAAEDDRDLAYRVNAEAPRHMALWAAEQGVPLVHFSTDYVFDGEGERAWQEDDTPRPLSVYGASKLAGDLAVRDAGGPHLIVRTSWIYAATGKNFMRTIARLATERRELRIVADQFGAPTSARMVAGAVADMVRASRPTMADRFRACGGLVNVSAAGETSWFGFASAIVAGLRARGVPLAVENVLAIKSEDYQTKATRPKNSRLDLGRLRRIFGISPPSWERALAVELDEFVGVSAPQ